MLSGGDTNTMTVIRNHACNTIHRIKAPFIMVSVQVAFAFVNILYKLSALNGMNLRILVAYRFLFAVAFIAPLAFFLERKSRPKLTWTVLGQAFLCGLFGGSLAQNLYLEGLSLTSATFASAMANLVPAITFILAVTFRFEKLAIQRMSGRAKVVGTLLGISGAMVLTFYKGIPINIWPSHTHLHNTHDHLTHVAASQPHDGNRILGALMSIASSFSYASWLIIQAKMSQKYPSYYSSTALMSIMAAGQAVFFALIVDHNWEHWKLAWNIRLLTAAYSGIVGSGIMVAAVAWCVRLKGPLYVSIFSPLMLIIVAIAGSLILNEELHLGSVLGAMLIVLGLYSVFWGKAQELKRPNKLMPSTNSGEDHAEETQTCSKKVDCDHKEIEREDSKNEANLDDDSVTIEIETLHKDIVAGDCKQLKGSCSDCS